MYALQYALHSLCGGGYYNMRVPNTGLARVIYFAFFIFGWGNLQIIVSTLTVVFIIIIIKLITQPNKLRC